MKIIFKTIPLGQDKQFCLDLPLQEDEIKLRVHSVEIDEGAGEGKGNNKNYWSCLREAWRKGQTWLMLHEWFAEKDFFDKLCLYRGKLSKATMPVFWCVHESELFNEEMEHPSPRPCRGLPRGWSAPLQEKIQPLAPSRENLFLRSLQAIPGNVRLLNLRLSRGVCM